MAVSLALELAQLHVPTFNSDLIGTLQSISSWLLGALQPGLLHHGFLVPEERLVCNGKAVCPAGQHKVVGYRNFHLAPRLSAGFMPSTSTVWVTNSRLQISPVALQQTHAKILQCIHTPCCSALAAQRLEDSWPRPEPLLKCKGFYAEETRLLG